MTERPIHIAVIGGSGLYDMPALENVREIDVETPFGPPSDSVIVGELEDVPVAFLPRHGKGHVLMPSEVPYRANVYALKSLGVRRIVGVSACGSLRAALAPGHIVVPDQLFDHTTLRARTFFGEGLVAHVSVADPFCPQLSAELADVTEAEGGTVHRGGRFITIEGPRFSTKSESNVYRAWGMDIIGMTTSPEAFLAREAGICYAVMAHITDYDVWHETEGTVTVEMVVRRFNANIDLARRTLTTLLPHLAEIGSPCGCEDALADALITARERIPDETREKLRPLVERFL